MNPSAIQSCGELAIAFAIVAGAFVSEDGATITAATLAASAVLDLKLAFFSAFTGLWVGDFGVYALARRVGPPILQHRWFRGFAVANSAAATKPGRDAHLTLALSRFVPGTRLPAYVSAGLGRMPMLAFAAITAISAAAWIVLLFAAVHFAPARAHAAKRQLAAIGAFDLILFAVLSLSRRWGRQLFRLIAISIERLKRWEFWPAWLFYSPVALFCTWLGIRYRSFSLPAVANLNQKNGGIVGESKIGILQTLMETSPEFTSEAYLIRNGSVCERMEIVQQLCSRREIPFPFVLKPNSAQRGAGFKKIASWKAAEQYFSRVSEPVVLQRYVDGPQEAGIFYYRFPHERAGHIFGITRKQFPFVVGDGIHTVAELIESDSRARLIAQTYLNRFKARAAEIPPIGERIRLVEAGNHCQGCIFQDGADLNTEALRAAFDRISQRLPGFFIGRYDVRYRGDSDLRAGTGFKIIELNGAASEATNIYDESNSLWSAYGTLYRQWRLVYQIGAANRRLGSRPPSPFAVFQDWIDFSRRAVQYPIAD